MICGCPTTQAVLTYVALKCHVFYVGNEPSMLAREYVAMSPRRQTLRLCIQYEAHFTAINYDK